MEIGIRQCLIVCVDLTPKGGKPLHWGKMGRWNFSKKSKKKKAVILLI